MSTGISSASAATLFISADSAAATPDMMPMCVSRLREADRATRPIHSTTPEFDSARLTTSTSAMMTVAG